MRERIAAAIGPLVGAALFGVAALLLRHELREFHYHDVMAHLAAIPASRLVAALALAAGSYLCLTGYDALAFRFQRLALPYSRIGLAAFVGYVFSHNLGFSFLG